MADETGWASAVAEAMARTAQAATVFTAFLEDLKGKKEPPRAYSMASAPHEKQLAFTIKEERYASGTTRYPPLLSPLLVKRTARGARLVITGFTGPYTLPADIESRTDHIVHVCAGSGIVSNFSIIKHALLHHPRLRHPTACRVYLCGPAVSTWDKKAAKEKGVEPAPRFLEGSLAALEEIGVPKAHVTRESYG